MNKVSGRKHNRHFARFITGLVISASVLLIGAVYGYAAVGGGTGSTSANVYGPSLLHGPLAGTSVGASTQALTFGVGGPSLLKGPLK